MAVLDPKREYVKYRYYRDACIEQDEVFIKDLNILGRDIGKMLIVDNTLHAFAYQVYFIRKRNKKVDNGVLIKSYEGGKTDRALTFLLPMLISIKNAEDVRIALKASCI